MKKKIPTGVLLINLGTPDSPETSAVRRFLREFLSDPRVIDLSFIPRWLLLNLFILPFRPRQSTKAYQKIWQPDGSPLLIYTQQLRDRVAEQLSDQYVVEFAMRYGTPNISSAMDRLISQRCHKIIIFPLFPQYSSATTGSVIENFLHTIRQRKNIPSIHVINSFYQDSRFIQAYATVVQESLNDFNPDLLLLSYHGLPEQHIEKSGCKKTMCNRNDACSIEINHPYCYRHHCYVTSQLLADTLGFSASQYTVAFQSRLGKTPWIKPYTDQLLPDLYQRGIRHLAIACPSFVADCLETLEEIGIRAREQWQTLGGGSFKLIPCLNAHPVWVEAVTQMIRAQKQSV